MEARDVTPTTPDAEALARTLLLFIRAQNDLDNSLSRVPRYTGQWMPADYVATEQDDRNKALNHLHQILKNL